MTVDVTRRSALAGVAATAAACAAAPKRSDDDRAGRFLHGVASGDPMSDRVVIWTRLTPGSPVPSRGTTLRWVVAEDPALTKIVAQGETRADPARDYCAKVDVTGLVPGATYYYAFSTAHAVSPVGRARTLPVGAVEQLRLAVFSCANYPFGRFHAYADMAARGDIDFALHLGDYIYETGGEGGWGWDEGLANGRAHDPPREIVSLDDYRARYRQYRSDPDLQAAHAAAPWILTWDDHEIANDPWTNGARNHDEDEGEGTWEDRKRNALQAYFEWMPIREPEPGRAREAIWRRFELGDLATLVVLETRLTGRERQLDYARDLPWIETAYKADMTGRMQVVPPDQLVPTPPPDVERLRTPFDAQGRPVLDYAEAKRLNEEGPGEGYSFRRDVDAFRALLMDPDRRMIDPEQEAWLVESVARAQERGSAWQLVGSQVMFARQDLFDLGRYYDEATLARLSESPFQAGQIERGRLGLPGNLDAWDGYPVQRDRIADALSASGAHALFLSGDTHAWWANEIVDSAGARCAAEFGTTAVSSPGYLEHAGLEPPIGEVFADGFPATRFADVLTRGYLVLTLTREQAVCDMVATAPPSAPDPEARIVKRWLQRRRDGEGVLPALEEGEV